MAGEFKKLEGMVKKHPVLMVGGGAVVFLIVYMVASKGSSGSTLTPQQQGQQDSFQLAMARIAAGVQNLQSNDAARTSIAGDRYGFLGTQVQANDQLKGITAQGTVDESLANIEAKVQESEISAESSIWANCGQTGGSFLGLFSFGTGGSCPSGSPSMGGGGFSFPSFGFGSSSPSPYGAYGMSPSPYPGYGGSYPPGSPYGYPPSPYGMSGYGMSPYGMPSYGMPGMSVMTPYGGGSASSGFMSWLGSLFGGGTGQTGQTPANIQETDSFIGSLGLAGGDPGGFLDGLL